jgi:integrase
MLTILDQPSMNDLIGRYLAHIEAGGFSEQTIRTRRVTLLAADRDLPHGVNHASVPELEDWLRQFRGWTLYTYFETLFKAYEFGVDRGYIDWNPTTVMIRPKQPKSVPRPVDVEDLVLALTLPYPWRLGPLLAAGAGLRCTEMCVLPREAVTRRWITALRKGGKTHLIPTHPRIWDEIRPLPLGPVLRKRDGTPFYPWYFGSRLKWHLGRIGLPGITLHRWRHSYGTWLMLPKEYGGAGASARATQELLDHEHLSSTEIYTAVTDRELRDAILSLPIPANPQQSAA